MYNARFQAKAQIDANFLFFKNSHRVGGSVSLYQLTSKF